MGNQESLAADCRRISMVGFNTLDAPSIKLCLCLCQFLDIIKMLHLPIGEEPFAGDYRISER